MSDPEGRVAALESEKRRLLESWQRERAENVRLQGVWTGRLG